MSNFTVESKSQLAKLLATENLTIQHQKISTARFDPKNRVLYCPIWQDMSGDMYDLLLGHEVGHALETPAEGWHDAVVDKSKGKHYKHFLNVVEDARIEKKIKRRYPGIRPSFIRAYKQLIDRDFFGLKGVNPNDLPFIDRLNLYTKGGTQWGITFTKEEQSMVDRVESAETWQDVLDITEVVFDYSKQEQQEMQMPDFKFEYKATDFDEFDNENEFDDGDDFGQPEASDDESEPEDTETGESEEDGEPQDTEEDASQSVGEKRDVEPEQTKSESANETTESKTNETEKSDTTLQREKDSVSSDSDQYDPECKTDEAYRQNETSLLDQACKEYVYVTFPKPNLADIVTGYKRVHEQLEFHFAKYPHVLDSAKLYNDFKSKNDRYISLLAKEFEMKKAAKAYSKTKTANTGDIDISRLYKYQVDDNIFKKMQRTPKGKSHGLVILLDRSGSMSDNMPGSLEQIMVLAAFCRKVNIPFVVYGFGDANEAREKDFPGKSYPACNFSRNLGEIVFNNVYLREYINSRASNAEFTRCMKNLATLKKSYEGGRMTRYLRPDSEHLSNTPLVQAMVALKPITDEFRKVNNLDLVNLCVVNDGDADSVNGVYGYHRDTHGSEYLAQKGFNTQTQNVVIRDKENKFEMLLPDTAPTGHWDDAMRYGVFQWFRKTTGCKIFGFYIAGEGQSLRQAMVNKYVDQDGRTLYDKLGIEVRGRHYYGNSPVRAELTKDMAKNLTKDKFLQSFNRGYNSFFMIPGGRALVIENEELEVEGKFTAKKLQSAFLKVAKAKQVNRVLVSKFIEGIAV